MIHFTIRDLLWLTVVAALGVGWWAERSRLARRAERADVLEAVVDSAGLEVVYTRCGNGISQINISRKSQ